MLSFCLLRTAAFLALFAGALRMRVRWDGRTDRRREKDSTLLQNHFHISSLSLCQAGKPLCPSCHPKVAMVVAGTPNTCPFPLLVPLPPPSGSSSQQWADLFSWVLLPLTRHEIMRQWHGEWKLLSKGQAAGRHGISPPHHLADRLCLQFPVPFPGLGRRWWAGGCWDLPWRSPLPAAASGLYNIFPNALIRHLLF